MQFILPELPYSDAALEPYIWHAGGIKPESAASGTAVVS
jgi:hypothetical protein